MLSQAKRSSTSRRPRRPWRAAPPRAGRGRPRAPRPCGPRPVRSPGRRRRQSLLADCSASVISTGRRCAQASSTAMGSPSLSEGRMKASARARLAALRGAELRTDEAHRVAELQGFGQAPQLGLVASPGPIRRSRAATAAHPPRPGAAPAPRHAAGLPGPSWDAAGPGTAGSARHPDRRPTRAARGLPPGSGRSTPLGMTATGFVRP